MNISALEYQLESQTGSQCEQMRAIRAAQQQVHIPQCSEDGRYRCTKSTDVLQMTKPI